MKYGIVYSSKTGNTKILADGTSIDINVSALQGALKQYSLKVPGWT